MGIAQILSGGTDGKYNIRLVKETAKAALRKTALEAKLTALLAIITTKELEFYAALAVFEAKRALLTAAITAYNAGTVTINDVEKAQSDMMTAYKDHVEKQRAYNRLVLEETSLQKQLDLLDLLFVNEDRANVWCADLTETLTGEVGTIEVNGEKTEIIIMPEGDPGLGKIQEAGAGTPAGTFYNWAVRPGWQKYKPTYRIGTITALTGDLCDIDLTPAASSDQNLNINQDETLINVPIEYMTCNGSAFEVGDEVVVEFEGQDWDAPKVVGFRANPKGCDISLWVINYQVLVSGGAYEHWYRLVMFTSVNYGSYQERSYEILEEANIPSIESPVECYPNDPQTDSRTLSESVYFNGAWYHFYNDRHWDTHEEGGHVVCDGYVDSIFFNDINITELYGIEQYYLVITSDKKLLIVDATSIHNNALIPYEPWRVWDYGPDYVYDENFNVVGICVEPGDYPPGYAYYAVNRSDTNFIYDKYIYDADLNLVGMTYTISETGGIFSYVSYLTTLGVSWRTLSGSLGKRIDFSNSCVDLWLTPSPGGVYPIGTKFLGSISEAYDSTIQG